MIFSDLFGKQLILSALCVSLAISCPSIHAADALEKEQAVVYLKNGNALSCIILREDDKTVTVDWQGGEIGLQKNEIAKIERQKNLRENDGIILAPRENPAEKWIYQNSPVVKLTNGQVLDAALSEIKEHVVILRRDLEEGGYAEQEIKRDRIESLEFRPVVNEASRKIEEKLRDQFPKMRFHRIGMVTLVTDSEGSALMELKRTLRDQEITLYFEFFGLLKKKQPEFQHFVVVFDSPSDYFEYALTDGIPAWLCPGYFSPIEKVLFMMNLGGQHVTDNIYQTVLGVRGAVDQQAQNLKNSVGGQYDIQIEALAKDVKIKVENAVAYLGGVYGGLSTMVLRHEFTHEFLHDWGLQTIIVSKMKEKDDALIQKKKDLFKADDLEKKKDLLLQIWNMQRNADEDVKTEASNSWFVEGLAEYAATTAIGEANEMRLYELKEARRKNELWPIEQLTVYKMGSFPGVTARSALSAYAQSWSFVGFLMKNYRKEFFSYLDRMRLEKPSGDDDLKWLIEALGKDLRTVEKEWIASIDALPNVEDPELEEFMRITEILGR